MLSSNSLTENLTQSTPATLSPHTILSSINATTGRSKSNQIITQIEYVIIHCRRLSAVCHKVMMRCISNITHNPITPHNT